MELPKTIRVGMADYKVLREHSPEIDGQSVIGWQRLETEEICVSDKVSDLRQVETYIHEVLHCLMDEAGLHEQSRDHTVIDPLTTSLMYYLMQNDLTWLNTYFKEVWNERYR